MGGCGGVHVLSRRVQTVVDQELPDYISDTMACWLQTVRGAIPCARAPLQHLGDST